MSGVENAVRAGLQDEFGAATAKVWRLGGAYHPSAGVTAEKVYPFAVEIDASSAETSALSWVRLEDLLQQRTSIRDGHLLIAALRTGHALGLLDEIDGTHARPG